jgi:class 3 adenylate cyclase/quercetin dioxygenase-like cupin family protein
MARLERLVLAGRQCKSGADGGLGHAWLPDPDLTAFASGPWLCHEAARASATKMSASRRRAAGRHMSGTEVMSAVDTPRPHTKNFSDPDETLDLTKGSAATVRIGELVVGRLVLEPGYRYSEHTGPTAGTASCQFHHIGLGISGAARFRMDDGTEFDVRAGDIFDIPPGHDTWVLGDQPAVSFIWGGWRGWGKPPVGERILTTILMTDIAGSTDRAVALGDSAWDRLLDRHHAAVREVLQRYRGTEIDTAGDGFLTMFDGAARTVRAAVDIRAAVRAVGLDIRAGIHTGEVEVVPGGIRGVTVHETARIMALGAAGEILVSSTTKELSAGSGLSYEDRGVHQLKGIASPRQVFALVEG